MLNGEKPRLIYGGANAEALPQGAPSLPEAMPETMDSAPTAG